MRTLGIMRTNADEIYTDVYGTEMDTSGQNYFVWKLVIEIYLELEILDLRFLLPLLPPLSLADSGFPPRAGGIGRQKGMVFVCIIL